MSSTPLRSLNYFRRSASTRIIKIALTRSRVNMKIIFLHILIGLLSGCATASVSEFRAPDGTAIKTVKCTSDPTKCFELASQSCPTDGVYRVISSKSNAGGLAADIIPGPVTWYYMTFSCGPSDGVLPDFKFVGSRYSPPPPPQSPVLIKQQPSTTSCTKLGNSVNCQTY